jgi:hypothetical protein
MIKHCLLLFLATIFFRAQVDDPKPLLAIHETLNDLSNSTGENISSCGTFYADGSYHLERRIQKMDNLKGVTQTIYEDALDHSQMRHLRNG